MRIRDHNGVDISSSFPVKVYYHSPSTQTINKTEENNLVDRQVSTSVISVIDSCYENETFIESHCTPQDDQESPLQAYSYTCRGMIHHWHSITNQYMGRRPVYRTRSGHCEPAHVCVDGFGTKQIASCVHTSLFDDYMIDKDGNVKGMLAGEIFDVVKAFAVLSSQDKNTLIGTDSMSIDAWHNTAALAKGAVQTAKCRDCADLETGLLQPNTDSLKVQATLMSTSAVAGIVWLALSAG